MRALVFLPAIATDRTEPAKHAADLLVPVARFSASGASSISFGFGYLESHE